MGWSPAEAEDDRSRKLRGTLITALGNLGDDEAIQALLKAESVDPGIADYPYARATVHLRKRDAARAREAALKALKASPYHQGARQLLQTLGRQQ